MARFMGPTWDPSGADRTQVGPILAQWTLLSGMPIYIRANYKNTVYHWSPCIGTYKEKFNLFFSLADCCSLDQANAFSVNNSIKSWICEDNWLKNYRSTLQIIKAILNVHLLINTNINKWWIVTRIKMHWHFTTAYLLHLVVDKSFAIQLSNRFLFA